jgi:hypothetical protein
VLDSQREGLSHLVDILRRDHRDIGIIVSGLKERRALKRNRVDGTDAMVAYGSAAGVPMTAASRPSAPTYSFFMPK